MELQSIFSLGPRHGGEQVATWRRLLGYGSGVLTATGAISMHLWLQHLGITHYPLMIFSLALVLSGWLFGFGPSVVTAAICGLAAIFFVHLNVSSPADLLGLSLYMLTCLGICLIVGRQRLMRLALERTVGELNLAKEQAENAREAAERASEAKEQFLHLMSHELRTPLQSITMSTYVLRQDLSNPQIAAQRLRRIDLAVRTLSDMIDNVVDSARLVTGQLQLDCRSIDLAFVIRSAVELMTPVAEAKQITLMSDIKADGVPIIGDPERLRECVCNLLENAIKFSAQGQEVRISLRRMGSSAEVQVTDRGDGIAPEFLPRVFERFAQANPSMQRRGGLGLGLSIVKHIVELHSGKIVAESEGKNRGASFTILLPYRLPTTSQPHP